MRSSRVSRRSIVEVTPPRRLAFRWNPLPGKEFADLTTLVEFTLTEADGGVLYKKVCVDGPVFPMGEVIFHG